MALVRRLPGQGVEVTLVSAPGEGARFVKGPIPWAWLDGAARLPGKALHVALALRLETGFRRSVTVTFCQRRAGFGVNEQAARRALRCLAGAGLVAVHRPPGSGLKVTVLDCPAERDS